MVRVRSSGLLSCDRIHLGLKYSHLYAFFVAFSISSVVISSVLIIDTWRINQIPVHYLASILSDDRQPIMPRQVDE